jgi:hypothetical protein
MTQTISKVFRNKFYTKRNSECTNVICCVCESAPTEDTNGNTITDGRWVEVSEIEGNHLFTSGGVRYYGYM